MVVCLCFMNPYIRLVLENKTVGDGRVCCLVNYTVRSDTICELLLSPIDKKTDQLCQFPTTQMVRGRQCCEVQKKAP